MDAHRGALLPTTPPVVQGGRPVEPNTPGLPRLPTLTETMATRAAFRDAMVAKLNDDVFVDALITEAYADAWRGRAGAHQTRKHLCRRMKDLFHIGSADSRPDDFDPASLATYDDVDGFLGHPDDDGALRNQLLIYSMVLICSLRIEASDSTKIKESWIDDMEEYPIIDELEADARLGKLRERAVTVCEQRTLAAPGNVAVGTGGQAIGGSVTAHTPTLSKMPKSCDTDSQKYRKMMGWLQEEPKNLVPSALSSYVHSWNKPVAIYGCEGPTAFVTWRA